MRLKNAIHNTFKGRLAPINRERVDPIDRRYLRYRRVDRPDNDTTCFA